jgi:predicted dehydrogenase
MDDGPRHVPGAPPGDLRRIVEPVRVGVVGVAGMGRAHYFAAASMPEYELAAICDVVDKVREKAAARLEVPGFADAAELYASGLLDAVVLATPPSTHVALVRDALAAGLHVYCEKPFVIDAADGYALGELARAAGLVVQIGFQYRFQPSYARVRSLIDARAVGPIFRSALVATNWFRPQDYFEAAGWRKEWRHAGGGVLMSQAIHQLDAMLWFTGLPARVTARASRARHDIEVEDDVMALLEFPNGGRGTIVASTVDPVGSDRIELHGEQCSLTMEEHELRIGTFDGPAQRLSDESTNHFDRVPVTWEDVAVPPAAPGGYDYMMEAHRDFVRAITEGSAPRVSPDEGTRAIEVANAVYLSAVRGEPVDLPLAPNEYAPVFGRLSSGTVALPSLARHR